MEEKVKPVPDKIQTEKTPLGKVGDKGAEGKYGRCPNCKREQFS